MIVKNGLLYSDAATQVPFHSSPNQQAGIKPIYLIMHYTACPSLEQAVSWLVDPRAKASAHVVIGRDGGCVQLVPFNRCAWHAGISQWGQIQGLNHYSIGIELANAGKLDKNPRGQWVSWSKIVIPDQEVCLAPFKNLPPQTGWQEYTEAQLETAFQVACALHHIYNFADILGHDDISPSRKIDPGPLFPMGSFRSKVLGRS